MATKTDSLIGADERAVSFSHIERLYLQRAIDVLSKQLENAAKKETSADIVSLREKEIENLRDMRKRLGA